MENEDISGLYELSGLKYEFDKLDKKLEEEKKKKEEEFWDTNDNEGIDPFWLK